MRKQRSIHGNGKDGDPVLDPTQMPPINEVENEDKDDARGTSNKINYANSRNELQTTRVGE